jgi:hypothetical protein
MEAKASDYLPFWFGPSLQDLISRPTVADEISKSEFCQLVRRLLLLRPVATEQKTLEPVVCRYPLSTRPM